MAQKYIRRKKREKTTSGYIPVYEKTIASAICFEDESTGIVNESDTLESRFGNILGMVSYLSAPGSANTPTENRIASSALGNILMTVFNGALKSTN